MAAMRRVAAVDEANLVLDHEGQVNVFLIAGMLTAGGFVGPDGLPDMAALRAGMERRIAGIPQLRKSAVPVGGRHRWAGTWPDLEAHIRLLGGVAGQSGLEHLCGELMNTPLPRSRPLWELLLVQDVSAARVGMVLRIHHALADGMAAVAIAQQLFDPDRAAAPAVTPRWAVDEGPRATVPRILNRVTLAFTRIRMTLTGHEIGSTVLLGKRSAHHGVGFLTADLAALEAYARPLGATANDSLLAAVATGYRAVLRAAGEKVPARLPVSVPVALRRRGTSGNQVGVMLVRLPLDEPDADQRLRLISSQTRTEKVRARQQGTLEFMRGPTGARLMDRVGAHQHLVGGFVTNVPGPVQALRLAGAPVADIWPVAVLAANVRLGVAATSYAGRLRCGIHFDADNVPGGEFVRAMDEEFARMIERKGKADARRD
ncbi:wax ester/triacylglycerol synthase domain-containing protein [Microbacterium sp.]|uniref:wax ester/triacylglycerol synthase domain-containing protein n=1 Tax=Microbacterium sp. TaxID=51671 RepID=UPI002E2EEFDA|nr:wax ester/triacylglycerol synthase domain-containing protein [Microbacterium sp.]HEX5728183.1 wax ester/triacylglycerol synthase domain-containing protein [Microbacterium sp.]